MKYLILSDLHVGDGSAKDDFYYDDELVELLKGYQDKSVTLILNGDILELVESQAVKELGMISFFELIEKLEPHVIDSIVENHQKAFSAIRDFAKRNPVIYIAGNHDYYILKNEKLQTRIKELIGDIEIKPYHFIEELSTLIIHGNQFDVLNRFIKDKKTGNLVPPLGDFIARYMMVNFEEYIEEIVPKNVIRDYDNVRPLLDVFNWFEHVTELYKIGEDLLELWIKNFLELMKCTTAKYWLKKNYPFLRFLSKLFLNRLGGMKLGEMLVRLTMKIRSWRRTDYLVKVAKKILMGKRGLKEEDFFGYEGNGIPKDPIRGIVMGHIHHAQLEIFHANGQHKFYLNTGTWRPVVERIRSVKRGFQKKAELTFALLSRNGKDVDISIHTTNKLEEISVS